MTPSPPGDRDYLQKARRALIDADNLSDRAKFKIAAIARLGRLPAMGRPQSQKRRPERRVSLSADRPRCSRCGSRQFKTILLTQGPHYAKAVCNACGRYLKF